MKKGKKLKKEKKIIIPNELSFGRWIAILFSTAGVYSAVLIVATIIHPKILNYLGSPGFEKITATFCGLDVGTMITFLSFVPAFFGFILFLKVIGKTSLKDFILGVDGSISIKSCLIIAGLFVLGFIICVLFSIKYIKLGDVEIGNYIVLIIFALSSVIFQISVEEFLCRGFFSRLFAKNKLGYNKRSFIAAIISSLVFASFHLFNPEMAAQSNTFNAILMFFAYALSGFIYFICNMHFKNLVPGFIIHFLNNFILFTLFSYQSSAITSSTIFIDTTPSSGALTLLSVVLTHLPLVIYIIVDCVRRKKLVTKTK